MIPMLTRHAFQVLRSAGHSQKGVAQLTRVSERKVRRIEAEPAVTEAGKPAKSRSAAWGCQQW